MARKNVNDLVAEAKARIEELSVAELQAEIASGDVTLVDIRDVRERWDKGTIPGAKSMPRGMLEFWFDPESKYYRSGFDFDARYVLYCAGGGRSALATVALEELGYTNIAPLTVGFNGWRDAGGDVEPVEPDPKYYRRD
jgi:rhodanese-related sulfurtransferase